MESYVDMILVHVNNKAMCYNLFNVLIISNNFKVNV